MRLRSVLQRQATFMRKTQPGGAAGRTNVIAPTRIVDRGTTAAGGNTNPIHFEDGDNIFNAEVSSSGAFLEATTLAGSFFASMSPTSLQVSVQQYLGDTLSFNVVADATSFLFHVQDSFGNNLLTINQATGDPPQIGFYDAATNGGAAKQTVTGSRGGNAALASLLTALDALGLITDSSS